MAEKEPNDQFREAREKNTTSPTHPKECLSRQEVAERANTWIWEHHHQKYDINAKYIGKIEQGVIRWPNALRREAFRAILDVPQDSELGFINARARLFGAVVKLNEVDNAKRRKLIETITVGVSGLVLVRPRTPRDEPVAAVLEIRSSIPDHVGATDIDQIRSATQMFDSHSRTYGGGVAREAVMGELRWSVGLLEATCPDRLRPELFSAVGYLTIVAAHMAYDTDAQEEARGLYGFALSCVEQAQDWRLQANVLSGMARQAVRTGRPDEGLTLAGMALIRPDQLIAPVRAMLHTDRGRALATMHQVQETLTAIGTADEHFAAATNDTPSPYNTARHNQLTGQTLADLAILGHDPGEATSRLIAAATGHAADHVRSRAISLTKLATLTMVTGDPLHAAALGHQALDITGSIRSHLATEELRELSRYATAHQKIEEVEHLRQRIATLLGTQNT